MKKSSKIILSVLVVAVVLFGTYRIVNNTLQPVWTVMLRWRKSLRAVGVWHVIQQILNSRFMRTSLLPVNW